MVNFTGIHHLALATCDMDTTVRFWRDLIGLRLVAGLGRPGYRQYFFALSAHEMLAFFEWPDVEKIPEKDHGVPVQGPFAFDHVSLAVASDDDLWELKDRLEAADFWVSEVINHGFIHSIYTFDPNRIALEFSAPVASVDLCQTPRMKDRRPTATALEGPDPQPGRWPDDYKATPAGDRRIYPGEGMILADEDD